MVDQEVVITAETKPPLPRIINKIILTLDNSLIPKEKLDTTPSQVQGLDKEIEKDLRILGCELIQTAGMLLKLPQVAMATAQVIFQRFYYSKCFIRHNIETVAMSSLFLASKIEEAPRRVRDVINVFHHIKQVRAQKDIQPITLDHVYTNIKNQVIKAERRVLKELGFCVHVKHSHKLILMYLQVLTLEKHENLMQMSWNFMNDSLRTDVFMRFQPEAIACACIYLSARKLGIVLPSNPSWYGLFKIPEDDIIDICYRIMELYHRPKPNVEKLETAVNELRQQYIESRKKKLEQNKPPPVVTTIVQKDSSHNAWGGFIQRTIPIPVASNAKITDKRHRSRSRSRSRCRSKSNSGSRAALANYRSRSLKKSHLRPRTPVKNNEKRSRHYSRSPSNSYRKSLKDRDRSDHNAYQKNCDKYRDRYHDRRDKERSKHHSRGRGSASEKQEQKTTSAVTTVTRKDISENASDCILERTIFIPVPSDAKSHKKRTRSRSRSTSRSRSKPNSRSSSSTLSADSESRLSKKSNHRSRTPAKSIEKKSRHYSQSSRERECSDYHADRKDRDKQRDRDHNSWDNKQNSQDSSGRGSGSEKQEQLTPSLVTIVDPKDSSQSHILVPSDTKSQNKRSHSISRRRSRSQSKSNSKSSSRTLSADDNNMSSKKGHHRSTTPVKSSEMKYRHYSRSSRDRERRSDYHADRNDRDKHRDHDYNRRDKERSKHFSSYSSGRGSGSEKQEQNTPPAVTTIDRKYTSDMSVTSDAQSKSKSFSSTSRRTSRNGSQIDSRSSSSTLSADCGSRSSKKSNHRSRTPSKNNEKRSRNYSRSPRDHKHLDYYANRKDRCTYKDDDHHDRRDKVSSKHHTQDSSSSGSEKKEQITPPAATVTIVDRKDTCDMSRRTSGSASKFNSRSSSRTLSADCEGRSSKKNHHRSRTPVKNNEKRSRHYSRSLRGHQHSDYYADRKYHGKHRDGDHHVRPDSESSKHHSKYSRGRNSHNSGSSNRRRNSSRERKR